MISVYIPSQLTAYSGAATRVPAKCLAVGEVLDDLDRWFPGLKFRVVDEQDRVRRHMRIFVGLRRDALHGPPARARQRGADLRRALRRLEPERPHLLHLW